MINCRAMSNDVNRGRFFFWPLMLFSNSQNNSQEVAIPIILNTLPIMLKLNQL